MEFSLKIILIFGKNIKIHQVMHSLSSYLNYIKLLNLIPMPGWHWVLSAFFTWGGLQQGPLHQTANFQLGQGKSQDYLSTGTWVLLLDASSHYWLVQSYKESEPECQQAIAKISKLTKHLLYNPVLQRWLGSHTL